MKSFSDRLSRAFAGTRTYDRTSSSPSRPFTVMVAGPEDLRKLVLPVDQRTPDRWFSTLISTDPGVPGFEANSTRTLTNNIRTFPLRLSGLRADGDNYWNAALYKQFAFKERYKMQLRTEWEGALNHPQFDAPNAAPTNTLFGKVSGIRGEARRIFVGLKLMF